ncbi:YmfQ family protein, partial [Clostridium puniceum]
EEIKKYMVDLNPYVPTFISELPEVKAIYDVESLELGLLKYQLEDVKKQFRIDTATWGLDWWENKYGVETNNLLSYEERREIVKAKKCGRGTTTKAMIKTTAERFSGGECKIIEHNGEYYFTVHFIGVKGIPKNMQAFKDMLDLIKPAHLAYDFAYTYNTWGMLKDSGLTWEQAQNITWDEIRTYD